MSTEPPKVTRGAAVGASVGTAGSVVIGQDTIAGAYQWWLTGTPPDQLSPATLALGAIVATAALSAVGYLLWWLLAKLGVPVPIRWADYLRQLQMFKPKPPA